jgi:hypothetical protein
VRAGALFIAVLFVQVNLMVDVSTRRSIHGSPA